MPLHFIYLFILNMNKLLEMLDNDNSKNRKKILVFIWLLSKARGYVPIHFILFILGTN